MRIMHKVGIKSGAFTLFHRGHIWCLQECRRYCDFLIVLTNSDEYIKNKKDSVPIPLEDRKYILEHIKGVYKVDSFDGSNEHEWIEHYKANQFHREFGNSAKLIVFHSDELKGNSWVPGQDIADQIVYISKVGKPESVSKIFKDIKNN